MPDTITAHKPHQTPSPDLTFAPRTPAPSHENNCRVHLSLVCPRQGLVTGACVWKGGKWPVPTPMTAYRTELAPHTPLNM